MTQTAPRRVEAVLFDKDGTLFDFANTWESWAESFLLRLTSGDADWANRLGANIGFDFGARRFAPDSIAIAETPDDLARALHDVLPEMAFETLLTILNDEAAKAPMSEVVPLAPFLTGLKGQGIYLGVATNDAETPALAHLDSVGVRGHFDFIVGSDSGFGAKPATGQLLAFCDTVGVSPEGTVMVGDSAHDLDAGRQAGMMTVGVLTGMAAREALTPLADVVFPHIGHLPDWIGSG